MVEKIAYPNQKNIYFFAIFNLLIISMKILFVNVKT